MKDTHLDAKDPVCSESAMVNPPSLRSSEEDRSPTVPRTEEITLMATANPRVFKLIIPHRPITKTDPKVFLDRAWGKLKPIIRSTFLDEPYDDYSSVDVFRAVTTAWEVSGDALLKLIQHECGTYISASIKSLEEQFNDDDPSVFVTLLEKYRLDFRRKMQFICSLAGGECHRVGGDTLRSHVADLLPNHLCLASQLCEKVLAKILLMIRDQRSGKCVDMGQLQSLMKVFYGRCFDKSGFKKPLLECTAEFYSPEAIQVFEQSDLPQYLKHVDRRLREEKAKCSSLFFFSMFNNELIEIIQREFLGVRASAILEKGFAKLMDENRDEDLRRMYDLFSEANLVGHLDEALRSYILETGWKILAQGGSSSLAEFKASLDQMCCAYFGENVLLDKTVQQCFIDLGLPWKDPFAEDMDFT